MSAYEKCGALSDKDIEEYIKSNDIVICPYNKNNLTPLGINLSFSKFLYSINNKVLYKVYLDKKTNELYCNIEPNDTVLILTKEAIWVSKKLLGTFHSKVGIVSKGFGHISTTLDPNWEGPLLFSLNNPTKKTIKLIIGEDKEDGIAYKTFITLILYKMISDAKGNQDNKPCRVDILRHVKDSLGTSKKEIQLINILNKIRDMECNQIGISEVPTGEERIVRIEKFQNKYSKFEININNSIDEANKISNSIMKRNHLCYYSIIAVCAIIFGILVYFGVNSYNNNNSSILSLLGVLVAIYICIFTCVENILRNKLL